MSTRVTKNVPPTLGSALVAFLFLTVMAICFLGTALILGLESRLFMERTGERTFRVTLDHYFASWKFRSRKLDGVTGVVKADAVRRDRRDSASEVRKQRRQVRVDFVAESGSRLGWDRQSDQLPIEEFMRGQEPNFSLMDAPPLWRRGIAWFLVVFGGLTFLGALRNFLPMK